MDNSVGVVNNNNKIVKRLSISNEYILLSRQFETQFSST